MEELKILGQPGSFFFFKLYCHSGSGSGKIKSREYRKVAGLLQREHSIYKDVGF